MIVNGIYVLLAFIGLGFLIFIHELGHYIMARRVGMKIEVFSIGFGKPIFSWIFQGVKWQLCYLPFGGYVKILGERQEDYQAGKSSEEVMFYAKRPQDRIKVAIMGPVVNIAFAFVLFTLIWLAGGKQEPFSQHTNLIGYVDPKSELYAKGVRAGDQITYYNHHEFRGFKDLLYASVLKEKAISIQGNKIDYLHQSEESFEYVLKPYTDPRSRRQQMQTIGILTPASFVVFSGGQGGVSLEDGPMKDSGIQEGDRVVWANGELVFSLQQLTKIINESSSLLTIRRGGEDLLIKVPRLKIKDLRLSAYQKAELEDWQHELHRKGSIKELFFIPYIVDHSATVKSAVTFIGEDSEEHTVYDNPEGTVLKAGDKILAIDGLYVSEGYDMMEILQHKHVKLIVQRGLSWQGLTWKNQNEKFIHALNAEHLQALITAFKDQKLLDSSGDLHMLSTVTPVSLNELPLSVSKKNWLVKEFATQQEQIAKIKDPVFKEEATKALEKNRQKLVLGLPFSDVSVQYNPNPLVVFQQVIGETFKTLSALVTGKLNPKWMSGPIGMVQIIHHGWTVGIKEALFWMGTISLSLGVFNLFPLPVLDGGHICFALYEWITKKKLNPKAMEKLIIPFVVGLIALLVYVTYQDIIRLFGRFF